MKDWWIPVALVAVLVVVFVPHGCNRRRQCGEMVPVTVDKYGRDLSLLVEKCPGKWVPVQTGPWWRCECPEAKP